MKRSEVKREDTWDLTKIFKDEEEYDEAYLKAEKLLKSIVSKKGHIIDSGKTLYDFLKTDDELSLCLEKIYLYSFLTHYEDMADDRGLQLKDRAERLFEKVDVATSFVQSELLSKDKQYYDELIDTVPELSKYSFSIEKLLRYKEHTLTEKEERIISQAQNAFGIGEAASSSLDNADAKFGKIKVDGKEVELTHSNFIKFMKSKDRNVRRSAFKKYYSFYIAHKNTFAELYKSQIKEDSFLAKVRNFPSALEASLYGDDIDKEVYESLIDRVHDKLSTVYEYMKFKKNELGLDEMHMYDIYVDTTKHIFHEYDFEEAKKTILKALNPLGKDYIASLKKLFDNRSIDRYPNDGKRSGAYEIAVYGVDPFVSVNFENDTESVSTLAHELGHAMHSYYSNKNQDHLNSEYPIFLAEIASTVNEVLLNEYLIENAKSDEERLSYVVSFLNNFRATVFRQTMFAEFEYLTHKMDDEGKALTSESLYNLYYDLNKKYYGQDVISDEEIGYEWSRIPHFYTPFYVYKYATGLSIALTFADEILSQEKGAVDNYMKFLSSGGSKYPLKTLEECGIDLKSGKPIERALEIFNKKLEEAKRLSEKVSK